MLLVSYPDQSSNEWLSIWKDTLAGLGFPVSGDLFTGQANGLVVNPESVHPITGQRSYAQNSYLTPALGRNNLSILTEAVVDKIIFKDSTSTEVVVDGVQYIKDGHTKIINAQEVVLAAGAINSPMLLERSGIGSAELLRNLGISTIVDNPNVGENLQDHIIVSVSSEVKDNLKTMDPLRRHDPAAIAAAKEAYKRQSGPWSTGGTSVTAQLPFPDIHTDKGKEELEQILTNNLDAKVNGGRHTTSTFDQAHKEFVRSMVSSPNEASGCYITFPGWKAFNPDGSIVSEPEENNYFSIILLNTHTLSRGSTHITSASALSPGAVAVDPGYLSHPLDLELFARNLRFLETVLASEPLLSQLKLGGKRNPSAPPVGGFTKLDTARDYVRSTGLAGTHFVGSCSMMPREMGGVVDPQLRVYEVKNLRVCDACIIPLIPRANPQATIYGVAEHGAYIIKSGLKT